MTIGNKNKKRAAIFIGVVAIMSQTLMAKPNMQKPEMFKMILKKVGGEPGPFAKAERFPKSYMLVHDNLPFLVGVTLFHPKGDEIGLSEEQLAKIVRIKDKTVPVVLKETKKIKDLEMTLAKAFAMKKDAPKPEKFFADLEKIAKQRLNISKAHLQCIQDVKDVTTQEQYAKLIKLATMKKKWPGNKPPLKTTDHGETVAFTQAGVLVRMFADKLGITPEQTQKFADEIMSQNAVRIQKLKKEAAGLESEVIKAVQIDGKTIDEVKETIDKIAELKKELAYERVKAYAKLRKILTPEQFKKGMKILSVHQ